MWNIYVVLAILVGVAYVMINHFSQVKKKNRYALIQFKEDDLNPQAVRNQWIGTHMEPVSDRYDFDDINIIRFFGTDVIDLTQVIVSGRENVVILQKLYGPTTILVPIDISVKLNISAIYSSVTFFDEDEYDLRYESLTLQGQSISMPIERLNWFSMWELDQWRYVVNEETVPIFNPNLFSCCFNWGYPCGYG